MSQSPPPAYDGPRLSLRRRHGVFPETSHDEIARLNFLAHMNRALGARVAPFVKAAWETGGSSGFRTRMAVRRKTGTRCGALLAEPMFQTWSVLRRLTAEQRQQAGRWTTLRQAETLAAKAEALTGGDDRLALDPALPIPPYVTAVDHHCMPGSYHTEAFPGDVANAANYDHAIFATTGGALGRYGDGGGQAVARWVRRALPEFRPRQILEIGATVGQSLLPIARAFPDAQVTAVDVGAPVLRYGLARAKSLGVDNVRFVQADGSDLSMFADGAFDWIQTTMFLHELSLSSMRAIFRESFRLLRPGGVVLHVEQPQYTPSMPLFEQAMRDWDGFYNNEPFWSTLHALDLDALLVEAGFDRARLIHDGVTAVVDREIFPDAADEEGEDYGRKAAWRVIGARK